MKNDLKVQLYVSSENNNSLYPRQITTTEKIREVYKLEKHTYDFMLEELRDYGRYWLNDSEILRAMK